MTNENLKGVVAEHARKVAERPQTRRLSNCDRDVLLELLDNPLAPNDALRIAAADFKQAVKSGTLIR